MHPVIKEKQLTEECLKIWREFKKCHKEKPVARLFRACSSLENDLNNCLTKEWQAKVEANKKGLDAFHRFQYLREVRKEMEKNRTVMDELSLEEKIKLAKKAAAEDV
jgi:hypothetical protein